MKALKDVQQY